MQLKHYNYSGGTCEQSIGLGIYEALLSPITYELHYYDLRVT